MTHDDLLKKLQVTDKTNMVMEIINAQLALHAVVRLHKPKEVFTVYGKTYTICAMCNGFQYPCPTIYAIDEAFS